MFDRQNSGIALLRLTGIGIVFFFQFVLHSSCHFSMVISRTILFVSAGCWRISRTISGLYFLNQYKANRLDKSSWIGIIPMATQNASMEIILLKAPVSRTNIPRNVAVPFLIFFAYAFYMILVNLPFGLVIPALRS